MKWIGKWMTNYIGKWKDRKNERVDKFIGEWNGD